MKSRTVIWILATIAVVTGISYGGWQFVRGRSAQHCSACERPVHANSRTIASVNGHKHTYCCPSCAITERKQSGARVELVSLTDYQTGKTIDPASAYLVRGSDVNSCAHHGAAIADDKHPMETQYDRCSPSLLAFASQPAAMEFVREHGGQLLRSSGLR